eukprot:TRINITY_DN5922_c0_g1_i1.p1 TRINITY_DN5922_c0_g1~~TRINITY_DN5922_c0_g1_i1.p1  ORF type:complete len:289 (-),score=58.39 TRINITY_DN5922_c0_g1_i1:153-1019(-)
MSRPEHFAPPEIFYNQDESVKYTTNSRIMEIQANMTNRALELLALPENKPCYILDIGCGSGLSGEVISEAGHEWVGVDISADMLNVARDREVDGDLFLWDMGHGMSFRPGTFDGAISISALQWLCNQDKTENIPQVRLKKFFQSLYNCLARGARAVFQFYPETPKQIELITTAAMRCGFAGGLVVDFPHSTKAKKFFLCLLAGSPQEYVQPRAVGEDYTGDEDTTHVAYSAGRDKAAGSAPSRLGKKKQKDSIKSKNWVIKKKERRRRQGLEVANDSKYTARKRRPKF